MGESKQKKAKIAAAPTNISSRPVQEKSKVNRVAAEMTYGKPQYKWMFIGIGCIALGMILMSGGWMPSPEVWDESIIYSPVRLTIAPIFILAGLGFQIYAIFKVE